MTTLRCLRLLDRQRLPEGWGVKTYLVDDGSSDGTAQAVASMFPEVSLVGGSGDLYWTGGMFMADKFAMTDQPDYLLWLNDDVELYGDAMDVLIRAAQRTENRAIVVGAVVDPDSKTVSYGGFRSSGKRPLDLELMRPNGHIQRAYNMNGNVVLMPRYVRERVGPLDTRFRHNMADMDIGFRAALAGIELVLAPKVIGRCRLNSNKGDWFLPRIPLRDRVRLARSVKGLPPGQWLRFTLRHTGWRWPLYFMGPYVRVLLGLGPPRSQGARPAADTSNRKGDVSPG